MLTILVHTILIYIYTITIIYIYIYIIIVHFLKIKFLKIIVHFLIYIYITYILRIVFYYFQNKHISTLRDIRFIHILYLYIICTCR